MPQAFNVHGKRVARPLLTKPKQMLSYVESQAETLTRTYTYDPLNRLTSVKGVGLVESASQFRRPVY